MKWRLMRLQERYRLNNYHTIYLHWQQVGGNEQLITEIDPVRGRVFLTRRGRTIGMKPERRERVTNAALSALAFWRMTDSVGGFPEQVLL